MIHRSFIPVIVAVSKLWRLMWFALVIFAIFKKESTVRSSELWNVIL